MRAAEEYEVHARDVCKVEVAKAESLAARQHEHTVNLIKRAAEMQLGDQKQHLMQEASRALEHQKAAMTREAEEYIHQQEQGLRQTVSVAETSFVQQRSNYDELSNYYHTEASIAQSQLQNLMNQRDTAYRDLQNSQISLNKAESSLAQQTLQAQSQVQNLTQQRDSACHELNHKARQLAEVTQELEDHKQESKQWIQTLGDTQSETTIAVRARDDLLQQLKQANFHLAQVQAEYNETKGHLQRTQAQEKTLQQQLLLARQEIDSLKSSNQFLNVQLSQQIEAGTPEQQNQDAPTPCPACPQYKIEIEGNRREIIALKDQVRKQDQIILDLDKELDERLERFAVLDDQYKERCQDYASQIQILEQENEDLQDRVKWYMDQEDEEHSQGPLPSSPPQQDLWPADGSVAQPLTATVS